MKRRNFKHYKCMNDRKGPITPTQWLPKPATSQFPHKRRALRASWSPSEEERESGAVTPRYWSESLLSGESPIAAGRLEAYSQVMKTGQKMKALTFGDLIESGYLTVGRRRACGIIRLAAQARLIAFHGPGHVMIPPGERDVPFRFT